MKWNQATIHKWGIDTFGSAALNSLGLAIRMARESIELSNILMTADEPEKIAMESADVAIVLLQVANGLSIDVATIDISTEVDDSLNNEMDVGARLNTATIDLVSALLNGARRDRLIEHIRVLLTCLSVLQELYEFDLKQKIQEKMDINAARTWKQNDDGSFQHV